jgi:hypothetical protein
MSAKPSEYTKIMNIEVVVQNRVVRLRLFEMAVPVEYGD